MYRRNIESENLLKFVNNLSYSASKCLKLFSKFFLFSEAFLHLRCITSSSSNVMNRFTFMGMAIPRTIGDFLLIEF